MSGRQPSLRTLTPGTSTTHVPASRSGSLPATSALPPFRRFAKGLRADDAAVNAGVTWPWSQGPTAGQSNRLKLLTRQV